MRKRIRSSGKDIYCINNAHRYIPRLWTLSHEQRLSAQFVTSTYIFTPHIIELPDQSLKDLLQEDVHQLEQYHQV